MLRMLLLMLGVGVLSVGLTTTLRAQEGDEAPDDRCEKCMLIGAGLGKFCDDHAKGAAFGVQLTSKKLFDTLQGTRLNREQPRGPKRIEGEAPRGARGN